MQPQPASQLAPRAVDWLWTGRLALGKLAILDGDPGLGKSWVTLDWCARLSTGRPFPEDAAELAPGNSLILNGEDAAADTIVPRLQALQADLSRVFVMHQEDDALALPLRLPTDIARLDQAVADCHARLVVIDPILAFLDAAVLSANDQSIRGALAPLAQLAERRRAVVLLVRHLNKTARGPSLYRGGGSIGIVGACRSAWLVAADPLLPGRRVLAEVKNNLAPRQSSLAFELAREDDSGPRLRWHGPTTWSADQLLAHAARCDDKVRRACEGLEDLLRPGPLPSAAVHAFVRNQNISRRTLRDARKLLQIRIGWTRTDRKTQAYWLLPGQTPPKSPDACDLEPWLKPLREKYPSSVTVEE